MTDNEKNGETMVKVEVKLQPWVQLLRDNPAAWEDLRDFLQKRAGATAEMAKKMLRHGQYPEASFQSGFEEGLKYLISVMSIHKQEEESYGNFQKSRHIDAAE